MGLDDSSSEASPSSEIGELSYTELLKEFQMLRQSWRTADRSRIEANDLFWEILDKEPDKVTADDMRFALMHFQWISR